MRCNWCKDNSLYEKYHDSEWGVPVYDDKILFEFLILESAQAGLSWITILKKRENFRRAYDNFDPLKVALYDEVKIVELMQDKGIVRYRRKIEASINNAKRFIEIQNEFGSFSSYLWSFTDGRVVDGRVETTENLPSTSNLSDTLAKDMKRRGFKFLGSTTLYSYLQAMGVINDHITSCFRYKEIKKSWN